MSFYLTIKGQVDKNSFYEQDIIFSDTRKNIGTIERTYLNEVI